jgi:hypothetical protein
MSDNSQAIVDVDASAEEAPRLAEELLAWLAGEGIVQPDPSDCILGEGQGYAPGPRFFVALETPSAEDFPRLWSNGLRIATGRQFFGTGGNGIVLSCAACRPRTRVLELATPVRRVPALRRDAAEAPNRAGAVSSMNQGWLGTFSMTSRSGRGALGRLLVLASVLLLSSSASRAQEIPVPEIPADIVAMSADEWTQLKVLEARVDGDLFRFHGGRNRRLNAEFNALPDSLPSAREEALQCATSEPLALEMAETAGVLRTLAGQLAALGRWLAKRPEAEVRALGEGYLPMKQVADSMSSVESGLRKGAAELATYCRGLQGRLPRVKVSITDVKWPISEAYRVVVRGRVLNRSGKKLEGVVLRLALLDEDGRPLGVTSTSLGGLAAKGVADFEALGLFPKRLGRVEVLEALDASPRR